MVPKQCPLLRYTFWYLICCAACFGSRDNSIYHTYPLTQPPTNLSYMTEIGFSSIVRLGLRVFGAQHPSELLMAYLAWLKELTQLWKSRRIYPKYMPKCSVGSTDHLCKFLLKKLRNVEDIDVWNFRQERFMLRHLRQWSKNFGFGSALSHNAGAANTILFTIQTFNEHSRMAKLSEPYLRGHMQ